jgi:LuxR family transcriptional regulator, maltose regulon positive regulatory protein
MTVSIDQPKQVRRERRIIERPRLIKMLDDCESRVILLLAPAGYGKTTLARQWAKTLNGVVWLGLTPAHRDVARFAEDLAAGIDPIGGKASEIVGEHIRSRSNPQRSAREIAKALVMQLHDARAQWVIFDDYHEVGGCPEINDLTTVLVENSDARVVVASRVRPGWATHRRMVYGEFAEIGKAALAMDDSESREVLGPRPELFPLIERAQGWPAVLGLAANTERAQPPTDVLASELYFYFAEELYQSLEEQLQQHLTRLALIPELTQDATAKELGRDAAAVIDRAREIGLMSGDSRELHPLIREFLLEKLAEDPDAERMARRAARTCVESARWDRALELALRFDLGDMIESLLESAYKPLLRSGHLGTLSTFASSVRTTPSFPAPVVDLVDADVALRDGAYDLASKLAERVRENLSSGHELASRANAIVGQSAYSQAHLQIAESAYHEAHSSAMDELDEAEALYGWALSAIQGEIGMPEMVLARLAQRRCSSPLDLVRHGSVELARRRFGPGYAGQLDVEECLHALSRVDDPRARSSLTFSTAYALALKGEYRQAADYAALAEHDVDEFDLAFARPHGNGTIALVALGLRRFGLAERRLQLLEDAARARPLGHHVLNARIMRIRLALQTGEIERARQLSLTPATEPAIQSLHAEYLAIRALTLAVIGDDVGARRNSNEALGKTTAVEVRVLAKAAEAVVEANEGNVRACLDLFAFATELGVWDPVVAALRSSRRLSDLAAGTTELHEALESLYERSNDLALARRAGFRTRSSRTPEQLLSPRELEVFGLLGNGFRNREIAKALVISESTTKVHVRHILEKLGVRTRTEAVARFRMFDL